MKKTLLLLISLLFLVTMIIGTSDRFMKWFYEDVKTSNPLLGSQKYIYGDLYGLSYLRAFRKPITNDCDIPLPLSKATKNINLYYVCDSYLRHYVPNDSVDKEFNSCSQGQWSGQDLEYSDFDTTRRNVLLIEIVERDALSLQDTNKVISKIHKQTLSPQARTIINDPVETKESFIGSIYNDNIESNLEKLLFDYSIFNSVKELKAEISYKLFGRVGKGAILSSDGKYLFYDVTIEANDPHSSFKPMPKEDVDNVVHSLNYLSVKYKNEGFDQVYFAFMPNPATILESNMGVYNQLIPLIVNHQDLNAKVIDVYPDFKRSKVQLYYNSDTHWNYNGFHVWLGKFYKELEQIDAIQNSVK